MQKATNNKTFLTLISKNKGLIIASVLPFIFWGVLLTLWFYRVPEGIGSSSATISKNNNQISISQIAKDTSAIDSDNDGLSDWEESIYGTNINNPDSDGDGYLDGEEIISGRDPLKKGPDDLLAKKQGALTKAELDKKTATEAFAKVAFKNFLASPAAQNWQNLSPEELDRLLKDSFKNNSEVTDDFRVQMRNVLFEFIPIDLDKKIKISDKSSPEEEQKYMAKFKETVEKTQSQYKDMPELSKIITIAFENKDFSKIDRAITYYDSLYNEFLKITAPKTLATPHREGLLLFYETGKILSAVKDWENDPVRALVSIQKYNGWIEKFEKLWKSVNSNQ